MADKHGPIQRKGTFLWQLDTPSGSGINLWSGSISPNNGYSREYAEKVAALFEAAPDLLEALRSFVFEFGDKTNSATVNKARAAIAKATASPSETPE